MVDETRSGAGCKATAPKRVIAKIFRHDETASHHSKQPGSVDQESDSPFVLCERHDVATLGASGDSHFWSITRHGISETTTTVLIH